MKKIVFSILALCAMELGAQQKWRVMFYNTENLFDTINDPNKNDEEFLPDSKLKWGTERYTNKTQKVAAVIDSVGGGSLPSIIGFSEIENEQVLKDVFSCPNLKNKTYSISTTDSPDERSIDVGLAYDNKQFTLVSKKELNASDSSLGNYKTRNILCVQLAINGSKETLMVFVNHWPSRREGEKESAPKRKYAASIIRKELAKKENKNAKVIIMGDFNDYPTNESIQLVLKAKQEPKAKDDLYNAMAKLESTKHQVGTHYYKKEWKILDQFIFSQNLTGTKGLRISKDGAKIFREFFLLYLDHNTAEEKPSRTFSGEKYHNGYSDHLPIYFDLEL